MAQAHILKIDKKMYGFQQIARLKLETVLKSIPGDNRALVVEKRLVRSMEHVCGAKWLRDHGISVIYKFSTINPPPNNKTLIYFISADLDVYSDVVEQITDYPIKPAAEDGSQHYHIIFHPKLLTSFEHILEEEGLHGLIGVHSYKWDFLVIDNDLAILDIPNIHRDVYLRHDRSLLSSIAHSLQLFQIVMSKPNVVMTYGPNAESILNMMHRIAEGNGTTPNKAPPDFNAMVIIDRNKDYPSCLLRPVIYAGLMPELFEYNGGTVEIETDGNRIVDHKIKFLLLEKPELQTEAITTSVRMMHSMDPIYDEHRYRHFSDVLTMICADARKLGIEGKSVKSMKIQELKDYVANRLSALTARKRDLSKHMLLCESIIRELGSTFELVQELEECSLRNMNRKSSIIRLDELLTIDGHRLNTLRLVALMHICWTLTYDEAHTFMRNYCNIYGHRYMPVFFELAKVNLFPDITQPVIKYNLLTSFVTNKGSTFQADANKLKSIPAPQVAANADRSDPDCPSFVFNGMYIPLVAQVCKLLVLANTTDDIAQKLGHFEDMKLQNKSNGLVRVRDLKKAINRNEITECFPLKPKTVFVFVVGGVTYAEVAACNLIERMTGSKIVLASDSVITGTDLMAGFFEQ